jgi:hypothetical protein
MAQVNGIAVWAAGIKAELAKRLTRQRKTQRDKRAGRGSESAVFGSQRSH